MQFFLLLALAYLSGSVPYGYIVSRARGVDIRKVGSGNIGGTNVTRAMGIRWGALVGFLDVLKGYLPVFAASHILSSPWQIAAIMAAPVLGHIFPVWLKFKGGKGIACLFGTLCPLVPSYFVLLILIGWIVALKLVKIMSLVNIVYVLLLPVMLWLLFRQPAFVVYAVCIDAVIWYAHRSNIARLRKGNELKLHI